MFIYIFCFIFTIKFTKVIKRLENSILNYTHDRNLNYRNTYSKNSLWVSCINILQIKHLRISLDFIIVSLVSKIKSSEINTNNNNIQKRIVYIILKFINLIMNN